VTVLHWLASSVFGLFGLLSQLPRGAAKTIGAFVAILLLVGLAEWAPDVLATAIEAASKAWADVRAEVLVRWLTDHPMA